MRTCLVLDGIKVDRSFAHLIANHGAGGTITRTIVALAGALGLSTVAEDAQMLEELTAIGCHSGQGFHISRPLPAAQAAAFLISMLPAWDADHASPTRP